MTPLAIQCAQLRLQPAEKACLIAVAIRADANLQAVANWAEIADDIKATRDTARRALQRLAIRGLMTVEVKPARGPGAKSHFKLLVPSWVMAERAAGRNPYLGAEDGR
jgi:predicted transcriptional regulator